MLRKASRNGSCKLSARAVKTHRGPLRTNKGSPNTSRKRVNARLAAG